MPIYGVMDKQKWSTHAAEYYLAIKKNGVLIDATRWRNPENVILKNFFLNREEGRKRERNINVWLPLVRPLLGTWPTTQACVLTGNQTSNPLVRRPALNLLSHTSQGSIVVSLK